jgi:hypothetical protein
VLFALQRGRSEPVGAIRSSGTAICLDFTARLVAAHDNKSADFRGPFVQGRPGDRFVYINAGTYAGDQESCWSRRAKVPLIRIAASLVRKLQATPHSRLEAVIAGTSKDGGPACGTVPLLESGWRVARQNDKRGARSEMRRFS